ncbi:hypothetical protein [Nocardia abscessus]|uniref:hypothetical protein n=1 Tax=Nocardia abscessus TaxID=120957 RepID=UPI0024549CFB|nr:hypothetical protein [Nocardia abscessus]
MADNITIAISDSNNGVVLATAMVEIVAGEARLTEVRATTGGDGFVPKALARLDFQLLVRTVTMLSMSSVHATTTTPPPPVSAEVSSPSAITDTATPPGDDSSRPTPSAVEQVVSEGNVGSSSSHNRPTNRMRVAHERAQLQQEQRNGMPLDFGVTYWRLGSIAKVARHYEVPHHIAQDWIKSLQQQGKLASPWPSKGSRATRSR